MDNETIKKSIMQQILQEANSANARTLMENMNQHCFDGCVPKPGTSLSSGEQKCVSQCMEKYIAAWNSVNAAYIRRLQQEMGEK
ncbi:protein translocase subunit [Sporothrix epigloea]|uniref:Mitochondrial import inner membrane translocase subunit n=1 Tax=Sporothrix epigloea TaxID=1892477 RepID=A0ABP0DKL9_9PEZI